MLAVLAVAAAAQPNLTKLILKPSDVGPKYALFLRTDGQGTAQRTLDLCGTSNYPSESLRVKRLQVDYNYPKGNAKLALSNEVVTYQPGGAAEAMKEVSQHAASCPHKPIAFEGQPPARYRITSIHDARLLPGAIALRIAVSATVKGKKVSFVRFAVYQRAGNVLSGVYSYSATGVTTAQQQQFVLHAAEASAKTLRAAQPSGPSA